MKIECPHCKLTGQTSDLNIPSEGRYMDCPRCKTSFFIKKTPVANWADTLTDCPECGYASFSAERFDICPTCGLVAKEYNARKKQQPPPARKSDLPAGQPAAIDKESMRQELERLEREEQKRRQHRMENMAVPAHAEESAPEVLSVPAPVKYLGWGFVAAGVLALVYGLIGWSGYWSMNPERAVTSSYEDPPSSAMLFLTQGLPPMLLIIIGLFAMVAANGFLKMQRSARKRMEIAAWCGVVCIIVSEALNLFTWFNRSSSDAAVVYYLVGISNSILMAALWSSPLLAAVWYLRRDVIVDEFEE